jgi:hypothetical protein
MRPGDLLVRLKEELIARRVPFADEGGVLRGEDGFGVQALWEAFAAITEIPAYESIIVDGEEWRVVREDDGDQLLFEVSLERSDWSSDPYRPPQLAFSRVFSFSRDEEDGWMTRVSLSVEFDPRVHLDDLGMHTLWGAGGPPGDAPEGALLYGRPDARQWSAQVSELLMRLDKTALDLAVRFSAIATDV